MVRVGSVETPRATVRPGSRLPDFQSERKRLVRLAYRMLGSFSEAEDVVQDAWLRWEQVDGGIDSPTAYLTRIVTRLCLDRLKSARSRRETYVGPWLPDPLVGSVDPEETIADDITVTLMLAMERLSPLERAAFLLHDVFDVALSDVAVTLSREPAAVRLRIACPEHQPAGEQEQEATWCRFAPLPSLPGADELAAERVA